MEEIVILSGARTAIGTFGGSLAGVPPTTLGATAARAALERAGVEGGQIGHVAYGHVINTEPRDMYLPHLGDGGRHPGQTPAMNVNRLCGSGAQAIVSVIQSPPWGDAEFGLAGGAESMSRGPHIVPDRAHRPEDGRRSRARHDDRRAALPLRQGHMGVTAENVADEHQITRADQDAFALESQKRAARAIEEGRFREQIVPVAVRVKRDMVNFDTDEHPKATTRRRSRG
jgi:acetyl-CoA C-acetyltransferase